MPLARSFDKNVCCIGTCFRVFSYHRAVAGEMQEGKVEKGISRCRQPASAYPLLRAMRLFFFFQPLPRGLAAGEHAADACDDEADEGETADDIPPVGIIDLRNPGVEQGIDDGGGAGDGANNGAEPENRHGEDALQVEALPVAEVENDDVDEKEGGRDGPDQRGRCLRDVVDLVRQVGWFADGDDVRNHKEGNGDEDDGDTALENDRAGRYAVSVEPRHTRRETPVDAAYQQQAGKGAVVDDGDDDEEADDADSCHAAQEFAQHGIDDLHQRETAD